MISLSPPPAAGAGAIAWPDTLRGAAFAAWLTAVAPVHALRPETVRPASADASFRRYFRIDREGAEGASAIVMDAPPAQEDTGPFLRVQRLMHDAGLKVPAVLAQDTVQGFLLLEDLGHRTLMELFDPADPQAALPRYRQAVEALVQWQAASRPGVLPPYDEPLLRRELALFPDWYLARHRGVVLQGDEAATLAAAFDAIVAKNLSAANVYVHRDFMPRNLMPPRLRAACSAPSSEQEARPLGNSPAVPPQQSPEYQGGDVRLGILDFQDAVYGPITYDIASLMRDAFISWDEEMVLDVTVRYWEAARRAKLPVDDDFGEFWRGVEWMGLQRHLKVAGIFARLTLRDGKPKYLADSPRFIGYIRATCSRYRELGPLLKLIDRVEGTTPVTGFAYGRM